MPTGERLIASLPLAIFKLDPQMTIAFANQAAENLAGMSAHKLAGQPLANVVKFADTDLSNRVANNDGELMAPRASVQAGDGEARVLDLTLSPVLGEEGWQVLTLTEAGKGTNDQSDPDGSALRAPAILSHEIKNPLAAIGGANQLLARKLDGKDLELTKLIAREVERIATLIDRMQSLGSEIPEPVAACNLHEAIRRARLVVETASDQRVKLVEEFDPSLPSVLVNQDALEQILINLLSNALQAISIQEVPEIIIRTRFASGLKLNVLRLGRAIQIPIEVSIIDNGPGVDPAVRDHIFEPFVSTRKDGQGLGLALVSKLVRDMNGRIGHERDDKAGLTTFRLHLAVAP